MWNDSNNKMDASFWVTWILLVIKVMVLLATMKVKWFPIYKQNSKLQYDIITKAIHGMTLDSEKTIKLFWDDYFISVLLQYM